MIFIILKMFFLLLIDKLLTDQKQNDLHFIFKISNSFSKLN